MPQNKTIKIAGINLDWPIGYAAVYKEKLDEMGFCCKVLAYEGKEYVAYSHKNFKRGEAEEVLKNLLEGDTDEGESKT